MARGDNKCAACGEFSGKGHKCPVSVTAPAGVKELAPVGGGVTEAPVAVGDRVSRAREVIGAGVASAVARVPFKTWSGTYEVTEKQALTLYQQYPDVVDIVEGKDGSIGVIVPMGEASNYSPREHQDGLIATYAAGPRARWFDNESEVDIDPDMMYAEEAIANLREKYGENAYIAPITAHEHGRVAFSLGRPPAGGDKWDTGVAGFAVIPEERVKEFYGDVSEESWERARESAALELDTYEKWVNGDVFIIAVVDPDGTHDDLWGYYGEDEARECLPDLGFEPKN